MSAYHTLYNVSPTRRLTFRRLMRAISAIFPRFSRHLVRSNFFPTAPKRLETRAFMAICLSYAVDTRMDCVVGEKKYADVPCFYFGEGEDGRVVRMILAVCTW